METILPYIQIVIALLLIVAILLQHSSAGIGAGLGGDNFSSAFHTRRGAEKVLFNGTIILGVLFTLAAVVALLF